MKKHLVIACCLLSFGGLLPAQTGGDGSRETIKAGVKAGLNIANVWDSQGESFEADAKIGFAGGLFLGVPIGKFLGVQPEVLVSQKGLRASGVLLGSDYSFIRTTTYIDVPLQLQLKPSDFLTILVGPQYSFLVHQQDKYTFGATELVQEQEFKNDKIRKNIFGFVAGADINISSLVIAPRVGWDFMNNNGDGTSTTPRYKNRWVQLTIGVRI